MLSYFCKTLLPTLLFGLLLLSQASPSAAQPEQDIKAAYLYNFIKFITWPEFTSEQTFNLCILGEDPLNSTLKRLDQRLVHGASLKIQNISSLSPASQCRVIFIGHSEERGLDGIFSFLGQSPVLTVSTIDDFASQGGTIGFVTLGNRVRFNINLKHAQQAKLTISSKLLELANKVVK